MMMMMVMMMMHLMMMHLMKHRPRLVFKVGRWCLFETPIKQLGAKWKGIYLVGGKVQMLDSSSFDCRYTLKRRKTSLFLSLFPNY